MKRIVKEAQPFDRLEISKEDLMRLFGVNTIDFVRHSWSFFFY